MSRKELKQRARQNLKKHYWLLLVVCLFAAFLGIEYGSSLLRIGYQEDPNSESGIQTIITDFLSGDEEAARQHVEQRREEIREHDTNAYLGRSRGVLSQILNSFSSGGILVSLSDALRSIGSSKNLSLALLILISLAVYIFVWLFIKETYLIVSRRIFLESRTYEKVPLYRFFYPIQTGRWLRMALVMFVRFLYQTLWYFTIIGGFIKSYSYRMVPYIAAENPNVRPNEAITLSRKMMKGHKWECFVADLSFLGWSILSLVTFGLSAVFYSNPYEAAFFAEFYTERRNEAIEKKLPGSELLCDTWLYQKPDSALLRTAYADAAKAVQQVPPAAAKPTGFAGFLSQWLGIQLVFSKTVAAYEQSESIRHQLKSANEILNAVVYPGRLAPAPMKFKTHDTSNLGADRSYTILNLILMFFLFSFIGWVWEVSLHLISDGIFVNRGVLHGPWLPIYGTGGILVLVLLKKFRKQPILEFLSAVVVCGSVEYFVAWNLEMTHNGQKWWDYTGYFLNLHGRICAEGLLIFGLGGLAIVYLLAPFLDNQLKKANRKILAVIAAVLLVFYIGDQAYSSKNPNTGEGISSSPVETQMNTPSDSEQESAAQAE